MSKLNRCVHGELELNHEGCNVRASTSEAKLRRMVLASMLFEDQFYIDGVSHYETVKQLVTQCDPKVVQLLAVEAREKLNLRHIPLMLARELARVGDLPAEVLTRLIKRPDEMGEFLAHYWKDGRQPLSHQVRKGLAACFHKFNEYQFAKWNKNSDAIKIRDILFLTHAKPKGDEQTELFKKIAEDRLETPDTWETQLSAGADKAKTFTRLMKDSKLGGLAFLRNLRNMRDSGVNENLIAEYAKTVDVSNVLPFRFLAAADNVPEYSHILQEMLFNKCKDLPKLEGNTIILVDVSGSMFGSSISKKSTMDRVHAAAALAILTKELCDNSLVVTFSVDVVIIDSFCRGFNLQNKILNSQLPGGTMLGKAIQTLNSTGVNYDRIIVITDEQSSDVVPPVKKDTKGYIINVASYGSGISHGSWTEISGFSESVLEYIKFVEESK